MTIEINVTFNTAYWHFLVKMHIGQFFLYQYCPYDSIKNNTNPQRTFKRYFSIWQILGLERTLLSELPDIPNAKHSSVVDFIDLGLKNIIEIIVIRSQRIKTI